MAQNFCRKFSRLLVAICTIAVLGGCAGGVNMAPTLSAKTNVTPEQGVVVARFINTSAYPLPFNFLTISPKNVNESDKIKPLRLTMLDTVITDSTIFAAPVEAGSYSLDNMYSFHSRGDYWYSRWAATNANLGTFEVKPGQVTDLGTIIYYPKPQEDKYSDEFSRIPSANPAEVLQQFFPFYDLQETEVLGWNEEGLDDDLQDKFVSIAQNPITYDESYKTRNGDVYFLGKLGVIVKRTADGDWDLDAVDTIVDMNTMVETATGHHLLAGNEGKVFFKAFGTQEWRDVSLSPNLSIDQLYVYDGDYVDALTRTDKKVEVYRANTNDSELTWQLMASYGRDRLWRDGNGEVQADFVVNNKGKNTTKVKPTKKKFTRVSFDDPNNPGQLVVELALNSVEVVFDNTSSQNFNIDLSTWEVTNTSSNQEFSRIINAGHTKVGVVEAGYWSWTGRPDYYVFDKALNDWVEMSSRIYTCDKHFTLSSDKKACIADENSEKAGAKAKLPEKDNFSFVTVPWFESAEKATAIVVFDTERVVVHTQDQGKTWDVVESELPNKYCSTFVGDIEDTLLLSCNGSTGEFYRSEDMGVSWEIVREYQSF